MPTTPQDDIGRVGASLFREADRARLNEVHAQLALVVYLAAETCPLKLRVLEGVRTPARQAELVRTGASRTQHSRHLTGHAVDLAPVVDGVPRWDWPLYFQIAEHMRRAAIALKVPLRWGGVWDTPLDQLPATAAEIEDAQGAYIERVRAAGQRPFLDGPHFEIPFDAPGYA